MYFEITEDKLGRLETKPLIPNGENIIVTDKVFCKGEVDIFLFYSVRLEHICSSF
jgi:hypothetical protein